MFEKEIVYYRNKIKFLSDFEREHILGKLKKISSFQKSIWLSYKREKQSHKYNLGFLLRFNDEITFVQSNKAIERVISKHILFQIFFLEDKETVYMVPIKRQPKIIHIYLETEHEMKKIASEEYRRPFDLENEFPVRFQIFKIGNKCFLLFSVHHIIMDDISLGIIKENFNEALKGSLDDETDHLFFNRRRCETETSSRFWQNYYDDFNAQNIPWTRSNISGKLLIESIPFPEEINPRIVDLSKDHGCLHFTIFKIALELAMFNWKGVSHFFTGTTVIDRKLSSEFRAVGPFLNTLKLKSTYFDDIILSKVIQITDDQLLTCMEHGDLGHYGIAEVGRAQDVSGFEVVLELQKQSLGKEYGFTELDIIPNNREARFPLSVFVIDCGGTYRLKLEYEDSFIDEIEINAFKDIYFKCLDWICNTANAQKKLADFFRPNSLSTISYEATRSVSTLSQLLEVVFDEAKGDVIIGEPTISKFQFSKLVRSFVSQLSQVKDDIIPIWTNRSGLDIVMMTAVWLANKKYLAIDKHWTKERVRKALSDFKSSSLHSPHILDKELKKLDIPVIQYSSFNDETYKPNSAQLNNAGYLIYSSGSTGVAKGVVVDQKAIVNFYNGLKDFISDLGIQRIALKAMFSFDAYIQQFVQVFMGKQLYILSEEESLDLDMFMKVLNNNKIELFDTTPSFLEVLLNNGVIELLQFVRVILVGGEKINNSLLKRLKDIPSIKFYNVYGPCEATVDVTYSLIDESTVEGEIGTPLVSSTISIHNTAGQVVPRKIPGEIVIQGDSVGAGYINTEEGRKGAFQTVRDDSGGATRCYRTGDIGFIDEQGKLFIKGRRDSQIKRHGVRIELDEIANAVLTLENVSKALPHFDDAKKQITLFVQTTKDDTKSIRTALSQILPRYYLPNRIISVKEFPINKSGKIDVDRMLTEMNQSNVQIEEPAQKVQRHSNKLLQIWTSLLNIDTIPVEDDFFDLGGDSLLGFRLINSIKKEYNVKLNILDLFNNGTFEKLDALIQSRQTRISKPEHKFLHSIITNEGSDSLYIFIHPVGGEVSWYFPILEHILGHPSVYCVMGNSEGYDTIDSYAEAISSEIATLCRVLKLNPTLIGWSFGGLLSTVLARKLTKQGIAPLRCILIDSRYNPDNLSFTNTFGIRSVVNNLLLSNKIKMTDQLVEKLKEIESQDGAEANYDNLWEFVNKLIKKEVDQEKIKTIVNRTNYHRKLVNSFIPGQLKLEIPFTVIDASESIKNNRKSLTSHIWEDESNLPISRHVIHGDHYSIMKSESLFELLNSIL